ncbi:hypothetical protein SAMN05216598_3642 [Pseudomonas asplenii]|uniref:Yip1 domain-containing protein n=1 Tax=Pseudomonas asplenii TaxID=53407 RepID=A0A1H1WYS9_9PSED|nr:hypothetical protein [Pseudomonas asplenii]SDT01921.1 hypothetical protein SAMN05216598_3642 [Pseudomonas asplenii]
MSIIEKTTEALIGKYWPLVCATALDATALIQSPRSFFKTMKGRSAFCPNAWFFGIFVAVGLGVISLPALRLAGVEPTYELAAVMTFINWLLILIYGICFAVAAQFLRSKQSLMVTINTFFFLSAYLVVLKIVEGPALGARFAGMLETCITLDYSQAVTAAIKKSQTYISANEHVGWGYLAFTGLMAWALKVLHDFGWIRALIATVIGMGLLSTVLAKLQEPIIAQMVCAYGQGS